MKAFAVTGTYHGSIVYANSEGDVRRAFHKAYNGESILSVVKKPLGYYPYTNEFSPTPDKQITPLIRL